MTSPTISFAIHPELKQYMTAIAERNNVSLSTVMQQLIEDAVVHNWSYGDEIPERIVDETEVIRDAIRALKSR